MARTFYIEIITPERTVYQGEVESLVVKAYEGYLGVLAGHAPLLAQLAIGEIRIREPHQREILFATGGGFLEVANDRVIILADSAERPEEIDVERARRALDRARARLAGRREDIDVARAEAAMERALNRLRITGALGIQGS